jgi:hypothetical protein
MPVQGKFGELETAQDQFEEVAVVRRGVLVERVPRTAQRKVRLAYLDTVSIVVE